MTQTSKKWLKRLTARLAEFLPSEEAAAEAREIAYVCLSLTPARLMMDEPLLLAKEQEDAIALVIEGRKDGIPLAYLLKEKEFYGESFFVQPGVLIPRDDTTLLCDAALAFLSKCPAPLSLRGGYPVQVWDLCAGSGCVGLTLAKNAPLAFVHLLEKETAAFETLEENSRRFGLPNIALHRADLFDAPLPGKESVSLIVSNPPYIPTGDLAGLQKEVQKEPETALDGGADGLCFYRGILDCWMPCLRPGGGLYVEIGYDQGESVPALFAAAGLKNVTLLQDTNGCDRVVFGQKAEV